MILTDITHRQTKEALIKYNITEEMLTIFINKQELRRYINKQAVKACHLKKNYHTDKYNIDMTYTNNMKEIKRNEGRERSLLRKLSNV
jgi:hypothetical protein